MSAPEVFGDPEAMRALARELMGRADVIGSALAGPAGALAGATFEGPAAATLTARADGAKAAAAGAAAAVRSVAAALAADANEVERMNDEARRKAEQEAERLREAARGAGQLDRPAPAGEPIASES